MFFPPEMLVLILSLESEISTCSEFLWTLWIVYHFYCIISFSASNFLIIMNLQLWWCEDENTHPITVCVQENQMFGAVGTPRCSASESGQFIGTSKMKECIKVCVWIYKTWLAPYCVCACVSVWPTEEAKTTKRARDDRVSLWVMSWIVWIVKPN